MSFDDLHHFHVGLHTLVRNHYGRVCRCFQDHLGAEGRMGRKGWMCMSDLYGGLRLSLSSFKRGISIWIKSDIREMERWRDGEMERW